MKKFFAILTIVGFIFFAACGSSSSQECDSKCKSKTECAKKCCDSGKTEGCESKKECCGEKNECCKSKVEGEEVKAEPAI